MAAAPLGVVYYTHRPEQKLGSTIFTDGMKVLSPTTLYSPVSTWLRKSNFLFLFLFSPCRRVTTSRRRSSPGSGSRRLIHITTPASSSQVSLKEETEGGRESCSLLSFSLNRNHRVGKGKKHFFLPLRINRAGKQVYFCAEILQGRRATQISLALYPSSFSQEVKLEDKCCEGKDILVKQSQDTLLSAEAVCNTWYLPTFVRKREAS